MQTYEHPFHENVIISQYLEGVNVVMDTPMVSMTLLPRTHSPTDIPTPPQNRIHNGVAVFGSTIPVVNISHKATRGPIALLCGWLKMGITKRTLLQQTTLWGRTYGVRVIHFRNNKLSEQYSSEQITQTYLEKRPVRSNDHDDLFMDVKAA